MSGLLDFLNSDDAKLGIGLLAAGGPTTDPNRTGFGQRLAGAMQGMQADKTNALRNSLMQSQIDENASQNAQRAAALVAAQRKQDILTQWMNRGQSGAASHGGLQAVDPSQGVGFMPSASMGGGSQMGGAQPGGVDDKYSPDSLAMLKLGAGVDMVDIAKLARPDWQNVNGSLINVNAPGFKGGYVADPTKGVDFQGGRVSLLPGSENLATLAGQAADATEGAKARTDLVNIKGPNGETRAVPRSSVLAASQGGGPVIGRPAAPGYATEPAMKATMQGGMGFDPAAAAREVAATQRDLNDPAKAAFLKPEDRAMMQQHIDQTKAQIAQYGGAAQPQPGAPAIGPRTPAVTQGNIVELSPAQQAANKASEAAQVDQAKADVVPKAQKAQAIASADYLSSVIDMAANHPGLKGSTGVQGVIDPRNYMPGTDQKNFSVVLDQLKGASFLQAFATLKGGGQITEIEGKKATDAIARLNTAQSTPEFTKALYELKGVVGNGVKRLKGEAVDTAPTGTDAPKLLDALPKTASVGARMRDTTTGKVMRFDGLAWKAE